jgi:CTP synthase (UTP-ammonia lyase)
MPEISRTHMGGTMRLGLRPTIFQKDSEWSRVRKLYGGADTVWERHRHRYEVNPTYVERLQESGMAFIGRDEKGERMQIMELPSTSPELIPPYTTLCISFFYRSSLFRWPAGAPRVLHASA